MSEIQDMVTCKTQPGVVMGSNLRVSVDDAIKVRTLDGAYATFEEGVNGSIVPGKLADVVILAKDPCKVPADSIKDITSGGHLSWRSKV